MSVAPPPLAASRGCPKRAPPPAPSILPRRARARARRGLLLLPGAVSLGVCVCVLLLAVAAACGCPAGGAQQAPADYLGRTRVDQPPAPLGRQRPFLLAARAHRCPLADGPPSSHGASLLGGTVCTFFVNLSILRRAPLGLRRLYITSAAPIAWGAGGLCRGYHRGGSAHCLLGRRGTTTRPKIHYSGKGELTLRCVRAEPPARCTCFVPAEPACSAGQPTDMGVLV